MMPTSKESVSKRQWRHLWALLTQTLDAQLAAPDGGCLIANASALWKCGTVIMLSKLSNVAGGNALDAARMQEPTHVQVIWMLYAGRMQL